MELIILLISSVLINNIIITRFLGICPFLGVSKKSDAALGMGAAVIFVTFIASVVTYAIYHLVLVNFSIEYMDLITFIVVIASLVQFVEMVIKKFSYNLYKSLGVYLPLITTNCAVLGVAIDNIRNQYDIASMLVYSIGVPVGFAMIMYIFAVIRERLDISDTPAGFKGMPIALITTAIMALAFAGFAGLV